MEKWKIQMPEDVIWIIQKLQENKKEAFAVGGCVRDSILGKEPKDWDITTSASPQQVKEIFKRTVDTGILHGTVTVLVGKCGYEVTTYRIDGKYEDSRHPKTVTFTENLVEDLKRRDFTINAMAYNEDIGLVDAFTGEEDLKNHMIRCVGDAKERFQEDALRMLRAVRFSAQLNFQVEKKTGEAIKELSQNLSFVSKERIQAELTKLLVSDNPEKIEKVFEYRLAEWIFPSYLKWEGELKERTRRLLQQTENDSILRWSAFLLLLRNRSQKKQETEAILKSLKFDNHTILFVSKLAEAWDYSYKTEETSVRKAIAEIGEEIFPLLLKLKKADNILEEEETEKIEKVLKIYKKIYERGDCLTIKGLAVTGNDFIADGIKPGKEMGEILKQLLEEVLEEPECNTKEYLLKRGKDIYKFHKVSEDEMRV